MKITNIFTFIEEFRNGRDIWTRNHIELAVREIRRLDKENQKLQLRLAASENAIVLTELNEMLKKTQARIAELEAQQRWIPTNERLPEDFERILVASNYYVRLSFVYHSVTGEVCWTDGEYGMFEGVTHWRPLPKLSEEGE